MAQVQSNVNPDVLQLLGLLVDQFQKDKDRDQEFDVLERQLAFQSEQSEIDRQARMAESEAERQFKAQQADTDRQFQQGIVNQGQEFEAEQAAEQREFATEQSQIEAKTTEAMQFRLMEKQASLSEKLAQKKEARALSRAEKKLSELEATDAEIAAIKKEQYKVEEDIAKLTAAQEDAASLAKVVTDGILSDADDALKAEQDTAAKVRELFRGSLITSLQGAGDQQEGLIARFKRNFGEQQDAINIDAFATRGEISASKTDNKVLQFGTLMAGFLQSAAAAGVSAPGLAITTAGETAFEAFADNRASATAGVDGVLRSLNTWVNNAVEVTVDDPNLQAAASAALRQSVTASILQSVGDPRAQQEASRARQSVAEYLQAGGSGSILYGMMDSMASVGGQQLDATSNNPEYAAAITESMKGFNIKEGQTRGILAGLNSVVDRFGDDTGFDPDQDHKMLKRSVLEPLMAKINIAVRDNDSDTLTSLMDQLKGTGIDLNELASLAKESNSNNQLLKEYQNAIKILDDKQDSIVARSRARGAIIDLGGDVE